MPCRVDGNPSRRITRQTSKILEQGHATYTENGIPFEKTAVGTLLGLDKWSIKGATWPDPPILNWIL